MKDFEKVIIAAQEKIKIALDDDFNTGEMFSAMFEVVRAFNASNFIKKKKDSNAKASVIYFRDWIKDWGTMSSLFQEDPAQILKDLDRVLIRMKKIDVSQVQLLINDRTHARDQKNWAKSDEIRDKLLSLGIEINDSPEGTTWEVKK